MAAYDAEARMIAEGGIDLRVPLYAYMIGEGGLDAITTLEARMIAEGKLTGVTEHTTGASSSRLQAVDSDAEVEY